MARHYSPYFEDPFLFKSHITSSPFRALVKILLLNASPPRSRELPKVPTAKPLMRAVATYLHGTTRRRCSSCRPSARSRPTCCARPRSGVRPCPSRTCGRSGCPTTPVTPSPSPRQSQSQRRPTCGGSGVLQAYASVILHERDRNTTTGIDIASRRSEQVEHSHSLPATTHLTPSSLFAMDPPPFVVARAKRTWRVGPL